MEFTQRGKRRLTFLNVTTLIDVLFLVLIFLVVSTTFRQDSAAVNLTLPRTTSPDATPRGPAVVVLTAGGELYLNDRRLGDAQLRAALKQIQASTGEDRLVLEADAHSQHGDVVRLIDLVRESGFTKVSLSARRAGGTEERP